jgi:hypothetical protein
MTGVRDKSKTGIRDKIKTGIRDKTKTKIRDKTRTATKATPTICGVFFSFKFNEPEALRGLG